MKFHRQICESWWHIIDIEAFGAVDNTCDSRCSKTTSGLLI